MKRTSKFILAGLLVISLLLAATSVWAGTRTGTLGPLVHDVKKIGDGNKTINMGDATFTITTSDSGYSFEVVRTKVANSFFGAPPAGLAYRSDGFMVSSSSSGASLVTACFAYTPQDASKEAAIYVYSGGSWTFLGGSVSGSPALICASTSVTDGGFVLLGNP